MLFIYLFYLLPLESAGLKDTKMFAVIVCILGLLHMSAACSLVSLILINCCFAYDTGNLLFAMSNIWLNLFLMI